MEHLIRGIEIEKISTYTTHYNVEQIIRCKDGESFEIHVVEQGCKISKIHIQVCGKTCLYTSDNDDIILKHVAGYEVIREELKEPEDIKDWTKLLA